MTEQERVGAIVEFLEGIREEPAQFHWGPGHNLINYLIRRARGMSDREAISEVQVS